MRRLAAPLALMLSFTALSGVFAQERSDGPGDGTNDERSGVSPARDIRHDGDRRQSPDRVLQHPEIRSIDGSGNNPFDAEMGATLIPLGRLVDADYGDGVSALAGQDRPGPREISNAVCVQADTRPNPFGATDFLWQWGQFVDHDIDLTDGVDPPEPEYIVVPAFDPVFDPLGTGVATIAFNRSNWDLETGTDPGNPRQQLNEITAWIDASNVYGSDPVRAEALRTMDGTGRLRTSDGNLLPFNDAGLPNAGGPGASLFLAGDVRANEQAGLTALHTLFVREHNRLAGEIAERHPELDGDRIYEEARRLVGAMMQAITYREFLPALLGPGAIGPYRGYDPDVDARISNLFSSAAYRFGHSALSPTLMRLDAQGDEIPEGHLPLRDAFFDPSILEDEGGIEPLLRGLAHQPCQSIDASIVDDVRDFLFETPQARGFDLAALNIQRGRDHGLPGYTATREALGLDALSDWRDINPDSDVGMRMASVYATVDDVDLWVGALSEPPLPGAHVGELNFVVIKGQFEKLRDGDRFWYQRVLRRSEREFVERSTLAEVIRRNTEIGDEIPDDVFRASPSGGGGGHGGGHKPRRWTRSTP